MMNLPEYLVWIDCEMTGLDPEADCLVEIAVVITDFELNVMDEGLDLVIKPRPESLANMNEYVRNMHTTSGLIEEFDNGIDLQTAETQVLEYIKKYVPAAKTAPLAGNTIGTDRMFIAKYMPALNEHLHYRNIDVSTIKELSKRWYPRAYFQAPKKEGGHRALADILESVEELRYYRKSVFVEGSGPSTEEAQDLAQSLKADKL
ncbi:MAG: oligoribonuclease [Micrococcales bacterium]|nr:oligoribonuclease [Micrococcales bacterium]NBR55413.1 oligoribonuclease [Micrococcales bacterium]NBT49510.1 oligoribonuclease [Actinomycetota bacterium]NBY44095.1 oligoribonuclease [Micrococcales bacterium]